MTSIQKVALTLKICTLKIIEKIHLDPLIRKQWDTWGLSSKKGAFILTCSEWSEADILCARLSAWCSWPRTRRSCQGTAPGGWCVQAVLLNTVQTVYSRSESSATWLHLKGRSTLFGAKKKERKKEQQFSVLKFGTVLSLSRLDAE